MDQATVIDTNDIALMEIDTKRESVVAVLKWTILTDAFLQMSYYLYL